MASGLLSGRVFSSSAAPGFSRRPWSPKGSLACGKWKLQQARTRGIEKPGRRSAWSDEGAVLVERATPIRARQVEFKARRQVSIPFREGAFPAAEYLQEPERVVRVTFPDSARITYMGDSVWRTRLKPITFFSVSATPVCDVGVYNKGSALQVHSNRLLLEFSGLADDFLSQSVQFRLRGQLQIAAKGGARPREGRELDFLGEVSLGLGVSLPAVFALLPDALLTTVGDGILDTILGAMESALVRGIIADYHSWSRNRKASDTNVGALRITRST